MIMGRAIFIKRVFLFSDDLSVVILNGSLDIMIFGTKFVSSIESKLTFLLI